MPRELPVSGKPHNRLSPVDAAFLYLERKEIPLHIASVGIFDGPIPFDEFVANIDSKLDLLVTNAGSNNVSVLLGDGTGGLGAPASFGSGGASSVAIDNENQLPA